MGEVGAGFDFFDQVDGLLLFFYEDVTYLGSFGINVFSLVGSVVSFEVGFGEVYLRGDEGVHQLLAEDVSCQFV